ncbi:16S rRNA (cytidine(1402)-2'-O)-methyltransferase [Canibacter zhoujuaniae]|uniref:16S rRNA (cytidine(1402)-2'-O)-methyltransferase n=1 Tax=Canibacter zhoujuaniae TaxID=2708343 RepID=UPI001423A902|nr:16S rRNA (cytidine(1402)-2'-O)-methyltransferase [Canibacter zhoujuaniae]
MLILAATPIGNLGDASPRLRETLAAADIIAAEDTRTTGQLLKLLDIKHSAKLVPLHDHNERQKADELAAAAVTQLVVLVSDAGMPTVSDPGFRVVAAAIARDVEISSIPGPSAPVTALAVSGIPTDRWSFEGFVPRKSGDKRKLFASLANETRTMLFFESPHRVHETLQAMQQYFGAERQAALCRELTKLHEEVIRGTLQKLTAATAAGVRGEIVLVVAGADPQIDTPETALQRVLERVASGERVKDATRAVAATSGIPARELYAMVTAMKDSARRGALNEK